MSAGELPKSISVPGEVPEERFSNYNEVQSVCAQMVQADERRALWRAEYEKVWGGNPTYSMEALKAANQSWRARANYREMEGVVSAENTLDYDLETEVDTIIDIDLDYGEGQEQQDWANCIEKNFTWLIRHRWEDYNFHIPFRIFQKTLHGMGAHLWPDVGANWIPRTPRPGHVLFPDDAPFNFNEDGEYFMVRDFLPANVLYRYIENSKQASEIGWEPKHVWQALANSSKSGNSTNISGYRPDEIQRSIRRGDIGYTATRQSGVWINTVFVREFETGMISQYAVAEKTDAGGYLFKKRNRFKDFSDILVLFPYDIGDGTLQGVKGLGARTKVFFELSNRIKNAMADQVFLGAYPHFMQSQQNLDPDKLKLMIAGGMRIAPFGLQEIISKYPPLDNGPLALSRELSQTMRSNNRGGLGGQMPEQVDRGTAEEYAMRARDANSLNNGSVALHRSCLRKLYQKMLFAACESSSSEKPWARMSREFRQRCLDKGVPKEAFKHIAEVRANVNSGKGSASAQLQNYMTLLQTVYPATSEDRKIAIERDIVANLFGYTNVDRYARSINDNELPDQDDSFAVQETDNLVQGGEALAAPRQDHVRHLQRHFAKAFEMAKAVSQGAMEHQQAYGAIAAIVAHGQQHLEFLQTNPTKKKEFGELYNQWQELQRVLNKLKAVIEDQMEMMPPEQEISEDMQIGMAKVDADAQVKQYKAEQDAARKMRDQQFKQRMEAVKTGSIIQFNRVKTASDIQLSAAGTAATIARDSAKSRASNGRRKP